MNWKRGLLSAAAIFLAVSAFAEIQPLMMNFQGKLINPSTNNPQSGVALLTFKIYDVPSGGTPLWTETGDGVSLTNGFFSVTLGSNTALSRDLFLGASAYLEVTAVSVNGAADGAAMTPRMPLVMSPYAFTANQLSDSTEVRLIAGVTYSTFTSGGVLTVPFGVSAPTATFTSVSTFSVISSSGIQMVAGTLDVSQSDGINANNTGIAAATGTFTSWVAASSGQFTATGGYSLTTSSGIEVQAGTLDVNGGGGISNAFGLTSATGTFTTSVVAASATVTATGGSYGLTVSSGILMDHGQLAIGSTARVISDDPVALATDISSNVEVEGNISAADFNWIFMASGTLTAAAATLTVPVPNANLTVVNGLPRGKVRIMISVPGTLSNTAHWELQFNGDTAADYATSLSEGIATPTGATSAANMALGTAANKDGGFCEVEGSPDVTNKVFDIRCTKSTMVKTAAPIIILGSGFWTNAATKITSILLLNSGGRTFPVGTAIRVFGAL